MKADHQNKLIEFYDSLEEPLKGTLLHLREFILKQDERLHETWKFGMPFFDLEKKMFCYFWFDKTDRKRPYLSFADGYRMEHPALESGDRKRFKILRFNPEQDLPMEEIHEVLITALKFY